MLAVTAEEGGQRAPQKDRPSPRDTAETYEQRYEVIRSLQDAAGGE